MEEIRASNMEEDWYENRPDTWENECLFTVVQNWYFVSEPKRTDLDVTNIPYDDIDSKIF